MADLIMRAKYSVSLIDVLTFCEGEHTHNLRVM